MWQKMYNKAKKIVILKEAASMAEYAILLGVITVVLITTITAFGTSIKGVFVKATSTMNTAASGS